MICGRNSKPTFSHKETGISFAVYYGGSHKKRMEMWVQLPQRGHQWAKLVDFTPLLGGSLAAPRCSDSLRKDTASGSSRGEWIGMDQCLKHERGTQRSSVELEPGWSLQLQGFDQFVGFQLDEQNLCNGNSETSQAVRNYTALWCTVLMPSIIDLGLVAYRAYPQHVATQQAGKLSRNSRCYGTSATQTMVMIHPWWFIRSP